MEEETNLTTSLAVFEPNKELSIFIHIFPSVHTMTVCGHTNTIFPLCQYVAIIF